jgi:hypothetical protein
MRVNILGRVRHLDVLNHWFRKKRWALMNVIKAIFLGISIAAMIIVGLGVKAVL